MWYLSILGLKLIHVSERGLWSSANMVHELTLHDKMLLVFHEERFKLTTFIKKMQVYFYFPWNKFNTTRVDTNHKAVSIEQCTLHHSAKPLKCGTQLVFAGIFSYVPNENLDCVLLGVNIRILKPWITCISSRKKVFTQQFDILLHHIFSYKFETLNHWDWQKRQPPNTTTHP